MHLVDRTDLFKISSLDLSRKAIVTSLYSRLMGKKVIRPSITQLIMSIGGI